MERIFKEVRTPLCYIYKFVKFSRLKSKILRDNLKGCKNIFLNKSATLSKISLSVLPRKQTGSLILRFAVTAGLKLLQMVNDYQNHQSKLMDLIPVKV